MFGPAGGIIPCVLCVANKCPQERDHQRRVATEGRGLGWVRAEEMEQELGMDDQVIFPRTVACEEVEF
jgi:hypothetical protein